ncbi:MAG TPA: DUF3043 domain-containing protein [Actinomycetales bacterium]|nr:DUF3043 domain-containing protein [Actinomycetales bacterium]
MLFRKKTSPEPEVTPPVPAEPVHGKGRATPTRKEAQAARHRPLVVDDRKAAKEAQRAARNEAYAKQQHALQHGVEKYLPPRDKGPVRKFARDFIDAGFNFGEMFMPMALGLMGVVLIFGLMQQAQLYAYTTMAMYAVIFIGLGHAALESWRMMWAAKKYFPEEEIPKWTRFYAFQRAFQVRRWRLPKPQVRRGEWPQEKLTPLGE